MEIASKKLLDMLKKSKNNHKIETASANAITILNAARFPFSGMDLSGVRIPGADLSGAVLDSANLSDSNLTGVNLRNAFLKNTDLSESTMDNVQFGEMPYLEGHSNSVLSVCFSPDGSKIASGSSDKTIRLWDVSTGRCLNTLEGHSGTVESVCFSPDGSKIASGSWDYSVKVWDVKTQRLIWTTNPRLYCKGVKVKGARGLSETNRQLLEQRGAGI